MEQQKSITQSRKGKHLNRNERILLEGFLRAGKTKSWIAKELQRDRKTIRAEIQRGASCEKVFQKSAFQRGKG